MYTIMKGSMGMLCAAILLSLLPSCAGETQVNNKETAVTAPAANANIYNPLQQVFCLNTLSNISAHYNGQSDSAIKAQTITAVNKVLADGNVQQYIGRWKCVWGPVVIDSAKNAAKTVAMNTMFIARNVDTPNLFVVAIAGTNPKSVAAWKFEDFNVVKTQKWPTYSGSLNPQVSDGTMTGFTILNTMQDPALNNITALSYIQSMTDSFNSQNKMRIWVTGHSLGGALSPTYALYLYDMLQSKGAPVAISCLPVAGATPGNADFATYYNQTLGPTTTRVWNRRDVVPHGFNDIMLAELYTIYDEDLIKTPELITKALPGIIIVGTAKKYTQLMADKNAGFTSDFFKDKDRYNKLILVNDFGGQALGQHIPAYAAYFQIDSFQTGVQRIIPNMPYPFFSEGLKPVGHKKDKQEVALAQ